MSLPEGIDLCAISAGESPDGTFNFKNPPTLKPVYISVTAVLLAISVIMVSGRFYINRNKLHSADWCVVVALIFNTAFTGVVLAQHNYSRHLWDIPVCWFNAWYFKILFVQATFFAPVFSSSKAAIFLLYRQLFNVKKSVNNAINFGLIFTGIMYLPNIPLAAVFEAPAAGKSWQSLITETKSHKMVYWGLVQSSLAVLLDIYIFVLPLPTIAKLHMPLGRRVQIAGVFTTALIGIVASVLSLVYRVQLLDTRDATWVSTLVTLCAVIENNVAIIVSCMPALAHLLKLHIGDSRVFKSLRSRLFGSYGSNKSGPSEQDGGRVMPTIGSAPVPRRREYYSLTDRTLFNTQVSASEHTVMPESGIIRSIAISQDVGKDSAERLV
ncbi:hypothetical protein CC86DRAFT_444281 [Ophiobolus disseminans]|uniref:Rhodopsin domain-containing protein n=1 Tax=Ophiobolus disseminans TaxID=1469910 RepID=A0A6A7A7F7_9PLEO|nr:hypothetical protein CC86DRAFT_444281 [Ophiobolus disseminans]